MLRVIELFGGIGAFSSALDRLKKNYEIVDYVDSDMAATQSYNAIHNTNFSPQQRIRVFTISILKDSDVIFNYKEPKRIPKVNINTILESKVGNKFYLKEEARTKLINNTLAMKNGERILTLNKPYIAASRGRNILNPNDRTSGVKTLVQRLEPNESYLSFTLTTVQKDNYVVEEGMKIRKLTPLESWRLMGFTDEEFAAAEYVSTNS